MKLSAIILAGGKSTRMKYNKELIKIKNEYLVHTQIKKLEKIFNEIIIVTNNVEHYKNYKVRVVSDILEGNTPIIGLHAGLLASKNEFNYVIACDMPNINLDFINFLISQVSDQDAIVCKQNNFIEPFNAIYNKKVKNQIESFVANNQYGFQRLVQSVNASYIKEKDVAKYNTVNMFMNINTEDDLLERTRKLAPILQNFEVTRVDGDTQFIKTDNVISEFPLSLYINNEFYAIIMMTPKDIEFMIIGFLHSNMLIQSVEEILSLNINLETKKSFVMLSHDIPSNRQDRLDIISSGCANNTKPINEDILPKISNTHDFDLSLIFEQVSQFNKESILFKETGGVHSVILFYDDKSILFEDIGRHNAVDKAVGFILKNDLKEKKTYILTSGRISSDILIKSALANIELIISRSAPTALAVKLAIRLGVKVYGFARGKKLNIYN